MANGEHPRDWKELSRATRVASAAGLLFVVTAIPGAASSRSSNPGCVDVWGEARYRNYGYDHIVHINNRCAALVTCDVSTDVNPGIQRVTIPPKQEIEVLTFRGSPSRDFVANAECRLTL